MHFAFLIVLGSIILGSALISYSRKRRREHASDVPEHLVMKMARGVSSRVFVGEDVLDGPKAGVINRSPADLILTADRLIVATRHGRVLEIKANGDGAVRCTGPRRLVIEGTRLRKSGKMPVRVELIVDEAEEWQALAAERLGTGLRA